MPPRCLALDRLSRPKNPQRSSRSNRTLGLNPRDQTGTSVLRPLRSLRQGSRTTSRPASRRLCLTVDKAMIRLRENPRVVLRRARLNLDRVSRGLQQDPRQSHRGATLPEVAHLAGLKVQCVEALERGRLRGAPLSVVAAAATALDLSAGDRSLLMRNASRRRKPLAMASPVGRLIMWFDASAEIHELTRDRALEERVLNQAATVLSPGPWSLGLLFQRRPHPCDQDPQLPSGSFS